jgi:hypothetical protein
MFDSMHGRIAALCALVASSTTPAGAQTATVSVPARTEQLVVEPGVPLRVIVTDKVRFKKNQPVHARVVEPVYAFDREVLSSGTEVLGRISGFRNAPRWTRIAALLGGNFTPLREPELTFDSLVKDGNSIPIETAVSAGSDTVVRFSTNPTAEKKGRIAAATEAARQQIENRKRAVIDAIKAPGKMARVKQALWSSAPWHPQYVDARSRFNLKLLSPLEFGEASIPLSELTELGTEPPADAVVAARLISSLDSRTSNHGTPVDAVLTRPLLSPDNQLIFPEGTQLSGNVTQAQPARHWHRNGKLAFMFTRIEPPASSLDDSHTPVVQEIEGRLDGVEVNGKDGAVQIDEEGGVAAASSKKRFIAPAVTMVLAMSGAEGPEPARIHHIPTGGYRNRYGTRLISGGIGLGLVGSALGRFIGPIGPILGFYGAGRSVYSNVVARGQEVNFPADTPIEIRFGSRVAAEK